MPDTRSTKKKAAAVSMLATATACAATSPCSSTSSHPITSSSSHYCSPLFAKRNTPCSDNTHSVGYTNIQAAQLLSLRIPRGGSSTEKDTSSSSKAKESRGGKESKSRKKKRGTSGSSSTDSNSSSSNNDTKQRHSKASSSKSASSSENVSSDTSNENETTPSSSQQETESSSSSSSLPPAAQSILTQTCHYDVLGITKSATQSQIQKAYRRRCVLTHPDKTKGDRSAFDKVSEAYDVLGCENKRAIYDRFGMEGLNGDLNGNGGGGGGGFNDVFRDFFGMSGTTTGFGTQFHPGGGGRSSSSSSSSSFGPRNRDLRYQLEVSLEDLYKGTTKHIAIQQPNPLRPHFPLRKEVEVTLTRGMHSGQSVRLSGVVDSIPDAAPADVVFLINQRHHPVYTRRGSDLAMEVHITLAEAIVGFKKKIVCLDGQEIVIGNPYETINVRKEELVDAPSLPDLMDVDDDSVEKESNNGNSTGVTSPDDATSTMKEFPIQQIVKTTTISFRFPSKIIQTGDVHVLKGKGMPIRGVGGHDYGDLYVQYIVDLPGGTSSSAASSLASQTKSQLDTNNLTAQERVELARLLSKLEGKEDPTTDVIKVWEEGDANNADKDVNGESFVHRLSVSSVSEFGRSAFENNDADHDDHLHQDDEEEEHHRGMNNFFHRAFHGGGRSSHSSGFSGPFGFGGASSSGGGFRYYSSSSGSGSRGGPVYGDEDGHNDVQCQQM
ncbi:DnaJ domain-containing protein [Skeletonema marinoi]|uniref:DnaJ domain-containing protein n=1 Tax=Skeletonema marinoi TaxID=267567 RepID=A0AAD9D7C1_9STRA|nr:DnaJ domain-containing protein [Skeletonema marinoi]